MAHNPPPVGWDGNTDGSILSAFDERVNDLEKDPARRQPQRGLCPAGNYSGFAAGARTTIGTAGKAQAISERDLRSAAVP